ncbi:caspase-1-like [Osmia bicornis bicornis]|uniref:caspase-1-like n=1 Tax=Osmia bicornis bicornis TaxID=1437191 RepID=UPI001EAF5F26|nr:caspase-1-like [Osmia bicornis bicornis]XP_046144716.1 caspase-1-like [Osmia bicornis bicornis]
MNQKHRDTIDLYCEDIVPRINVNKLWPKLLENKVFNRDDVNIPRWKKSFTDKATVKDIYLTIKTRGPLAFDRFLASLRQSDHENLANTLEGKKITFRSIEVERNVNQDNNINDNHVEEEAANVEGVQDDFFYNMQLSEVPLCIRVRKASKFLDGPEYENVQRYPMRSKPRGLVLIITNIHFKHPDIESRNSAVHDEQNLKRLFEQMGFQVITHLHLTGEELLEKIKEFSQLKELRKVDSCFIFISSHGNTNTEYEVTEIQGVDYNPDSKERNYKTVLCTDILHNFTAEACPHLAGKPKIFIFQLCRGDRKQKSVKKPRHTTDTCNIRSSDEMINLKMNGKETMRNNADTLIVHATLPGHVAFRDKITGSWFIQILCEVFMNYAHKTHLEDLLHMVDERLKIQRTTNDECQTLMVTSIGFNKHCYLNPGLFEDT